MNKPFLVNATYSNTLYIYLFGYLLLSKKEFQSQGARRQDPVVFHFVDMFGLY